MQIITLTRQIVTFFGSTTVYTIGICFETTKNAKAFERFFYWISAFPMKIYHNWKPLFSEIQAVIGYRCLCCALTNQ